MLTYVLTDIHGRFDLLKKALAYIEKNAGKEEYKVIFLGDYVDRGPQSMEVVSFIKYLNESNPDKYIALQGNHEDIFINYLRQSRRYPEGIFENNGGIETLLSYVYPDKKPTPDLQKAYDKYVTDYGKWQTNGGEKPDDAVAKAYYGTITRNLDYNLMKLHSSWMHRLPRHYKDGMRLYVHAGIDPRYSLEDQLSDDLIWTRSPAFLYAYREELGYYVVHGHTCYHAQKKFNEPENTDARCNLDTGACSSGILSVGVFNDTQEKPIEIVAITLES